MRPKASSSARKYSCLELDCALHRPLIHLQLSHNGRKNRYQKLARQPWGPPPRLKFRSNGRKYRCRKLTSHPWEPLILPKSSRSEGKCCCVELGYQPLPWRKPQFQPLFCPASSRRPLDCRLPPCVPPLLTTLAALGCCKQQIFPPRQLASFTATIRDLPRTSSSAPMMLYQPL